MTADIFGVQFHGFAERNHLRRAVLAACVGAPDRRAADISTVPGDHDPLDVLFGVLAVAREQCQSDGQGSAVSNTENLIGGTGDHAHRELVNVSPRRRPSHPALSI